MKIQAKPSITEQFVYLFHYNKHIMKSLLFFRSGLCQVLVGIFPFFFMNPRNRQITEPLLSGFRTQKIHFKEWLPFFPCMLYLKNV